MTSPDNAGPRRIPIIYIAGPFRAPTAWGIAENVRNAERVGLEVARLGAMPLIPHANTAHFHGEGPSDGADAFWLDGTLELLRRCDAAVFIPGWPKSSGSRGEWAECERLGLPRLDLHDIQGLPPTQIQATLSHWLKTL